MEIVPPLVIVQKDGVGDVARFTDYVRRNSRETLETVERPVAMVIQAPRGRAIIFKSSKKYYDPYYGSYLPQSLAVKAFVEQHRND